MKYEQIRWSFILTAEADRKEKNAFFLCTFNKTHLFLYLVPPVGSFEMFPVFFFLVVYEISKNADWRKNKDRREQKLRAEKTKFFIIVIKILSPYKRKRVACCVLPSARRPNGTRCRQSFPPLTERNT